jgi:hypothetical protein
MSCGDYSGMGCSGGYDGMCQSSKYSTGDPMGDDSSCRAQYCTSKEEENPIA